MAAVHSDKLLGGAGDDTLIDDTQSNNWFVGGRGHDTVEIQLPTSIPSQRPTNLSYSIEDGYKQPDFSQGGSLLTFWLVMEDSNRNTKQRISIGDVEEIYIDNPHNRKNVSIDVVEKAKEVYIGELNQNKGVIDFLKPLDKIQRH